MAEVTTIDILKGFRIKKKILTIGLGYSFQQVSKLPIEDFDKSLNYIITNKKIYK